MSQNRLRILAPVLAAALGLLLGLQVSCSTSACEFCDKAKAVGATTLAASYVNATTSVGTGLRVVPTHSGGLISSATVASGAVPPGMVLNSDGTVTGTPTQAGVFPVAITLCNQGVCVTRPVVITVNSGALDPLNASYTDAGTLVGTALTVPLNPTVINGPVTSAALVPGTGALPAGMGLAATGTISGTPTAAGIYPVTVDLANAAGAHAAAPVIITVSAASATALTGAYTDTYGTAGQPLAVAAPALTGGPAVSATLTGGILPAGMVLNADGSITGTPTQEGTYPATISLTNASGGQVTIKVLVTINTSGAGAGMTAAYTDLATEVGLPTTLAPAVTHGPVTSAHVFSGSLPPGLTLNDDGSLSGTPTMLGVFTVEVTLGNAAGSFVVAPVTITVTRPNLALAYGDRLLPQGTAMTAAASVANVKAGLPTSFAVTAGSLPPGLALDPATGIIAGTPATPGLFPFTVTITNGPRVASGQATYTVTPSAPLAVGYTPTLAAPAGTPIATQTPALANPTPGLPTTYAVTSGILPTGLALDPVTGIISGTPTTPGVSTFTVTATNGTRSATFTPTWTVVPAAPLTVAYTPALNAPAGTAIASQVPALANPTPGVPTTYAVTAGTLPAGLTLDPATGQITGTPTAPGVYAFTVTATNGTRSATFAPVYTVTPAAALTVAYTTPQIFTAGTAITSQVPALANATPGIPTTYAVPSGTLPPGLSLDPATGILTGTPTTSGIYPLTITATNGTRQATATPSYTVIPSGALTVAYTTPLALPAGSTIPAQTPVLANPTPGVSTTYAVTTGSLPAGLALDPATGTVSGTPTTPGVVTFTVTATNGAHTAASTATWTITPAAALTETYTSQVFPAGSAIAAQTPVLANPTPGVATTYAVTTGTLPAGLSLAAATGVITGAPTTPGVSTFTVTATNGTRTATSTPTYTVTPVAALTETYASQAFPAGSAIAAQTPVLANATPGVATTYAVTTGTLPTGLSLAAATGVITGTPTTPGVSTFTVTATNGTRSATSTPTYTVTPAAALSETYASQAFPAGSAIAAQTPVLANPTPGVATTYAVTSGTLPAGLSLAAATGVITGTPTTPGVSTFTVTATNGARTATSTPTYTVTPAAALTVAYGSLTVPQNAAIAGQSPTLANATPGVATAYAVTTGTLPAGLSLAAATGVITGTPTTPGVSTFTVTATNGTRSATSTPTYTVTPTAALTLAYGNLMVPQNVAITSQNPVLADATPGVATTYAVTTGTLPAGLSLNAATGVISGTPTAAGVTPFTITATNGTTNGTTPRTAAASATYTVVGTPTALLTASPLLPLVGTASTLTPTFTVPGGGTAIISQSVNGGLGVASGTGYTTGVRATTGSTTYTLTVTNSLNVVATSSVTVKWVSNTVTLTITNTGTTTVYSGSNDPDSPLYGLQVVVPDQGAYDQYHSVLCSGDTSLTVTRETTLTVGTPLPAGAYDYSHSFNFVSSVGYPFRTPVTVTLPYDPNLAATPLGAGDVPMPFFWDAHYSKWVAASLKSIDSGQHTVTFTTLLPGRYAVLGIPGLGASVVKNLTPAFSWGTDDWLQWNTGNFTSPGGSSLGMSALASWYFPLWKANAGNTTKLNTGLHSVFASAADVNARALMSRMANGTLENWNGAWKQQFISASGPVNYALTDTQTGLALITALTIAAQPQVFLMADARPATANAVATAIYGYDGAGAFSVMDPNYPGDATTRLTIAWDPTANAGAGQFSAYARAGGYNPALAQYALEGETSIHRLSDYELVFDGATRATPWQHPPFATLAMTAIGDSSQVANLTVTQRVTPPSLGGPAVFVVTGHVVNGSDSPAHDTVFLSMNGGTRIAQLLDASGNFAFNVSHPLPNPYGTPFMLETTPDPCDPTFQHSGFQAFKVASLDPWFVNNCFENGAANPTPWVVQYGNNTSVSYPAYPAFTTDPHQGTGTQVATNQSTLMDANSVPMDPNVPTIPAVLGGRYSYRINGPVTQQKVGRMYQSVTVPATVANPTLTFYWAAVMQSAGHVPAQLPYVDIEVLDVTNGNEQVFFVHHFAPSTTGGVTYTDLYPGWIAGNGTGAAQWFGIDWQKVGLQLGTNRGSHVLTVRITAADCNQGGHGGYAYIDNLECD